MQFLMCLPYILSFLRKKILKEFVRYYWQMGVYHMHGWLVMHLANFLHHSKFTMWLTSSQDCRNQCYESYYLNFITAIMRRQLEDLATAVLQGDCVSQVSKVFDQYLNFISLEENMFTTRYQERDSISYYGERIDWKDTWKKHVWWSNWLSSEFSNTLF